MMPLFSLKWFSSSERIDIILKDAFPCTVLVMQMISFSVFVSNYRAFIIFCRCHFITQNPNDTTGLDQLVPATSMVFPSFIKV